MPYNHTGIPEEPNQPQMLIDLIPEQNFNIPPKELRLELLRMVYMNPKTEGTIDSIYQVVLGMEAFINAAEE